MAFFYLAIASGAGLNFHYCMGELVDWSLVQSQQQACGSCGMEKKESSKETCCKDVQHQVKIEQAQKSAAQMYKFEQVFFVIPQASSVANHLSAPLPFISKEIRSNTSPLGLECPIFIKNCTYRI